jgi:hypothetical protein
MTIDEAVRQQLKELMIDLFQQDPRILTRVGIPKQRRNYFKRGRKVDVETLPPADLLLAALVLLRKEVVIEGLSLGSGGAQAPAYLVGARELGSGTPTTSITPPFQMSLLAALDFPPETETVLECVEKKGPHRVELAITLGAFRKVG